RRARGRPAPAPAWSPAFVPPWTRPSHRLIAYIQYVCRLGGGEVRARAALQKHWLDLTDVGVSTRVLDAGAGPPVLLLHGNPGTAAAGRGVVARLAGRHRCIAPDFPGYGRSPEPPASFTYALGDQARFVDAVLRALRVDERVVLVVHDTGGMVGTAWAAAN